MNKRTTGERIFTVLNSMVLGIIVFISLYPLWHVMVASFSENTEVLRHRGLMLWPVGHMNLDAYNVVFQNTMDLRGYGNTLFVVVMGCFIKNI